MKKSIGILVFTILLCSAAAGQSKYTPEMYRVSPVAGYTGVGYVGNFGAGAYLGMNIFRAFPKKVGFFAEFKMGQIKTYENSNYYENISVAQAEGWGDERTKTDVEPFIVNGGITMMHGNRLISYVGIGISRMSKYYQYYDPMHILGSNGNYWIDGPTGAMGINFVGGGMYRVTPTVALLVGFDTNPSGLNVGVSMDLPGLRI